MKKTQTKIALTQSQTGAEDLAVAECESSSVDETLLLLQDFLRQHWNTHQKYPRLMITVHAEISEEDFKKISIEEEEEP